MQKIQLKNGQTATIDFGRNQDLESLAVFLKTKPSSLAVDTLQGMLEEVDYYRLRGCYVDGFPAVAAGPSTEQSEIGTVWVAKLGDAVAAAAFFHVTWKKNVYLDWLATVPEYSGLDIGAFLLIEILATATRIGSRLFFHRIQKRGGGQGLQEDPEVERRMRHDSLV